MLSLTDAVANAERDAPSLAARRAAEESARHLVEPAGALPDPELIVGIENLPVAGPDAGSLTADFMTMRRVGAMQEFPRTATRAARTERARAELEREQVRSDVETSALRESVAKAWIQAELAGRRLALLEALKPRLDAQVIAADAALASGRGSVADGIAARAQRTALEDRMAIAERDAITARATLARWLPEDAWRPLANAPDYRSLEREAAAILADVARHRGLQQYEVEARIADAELALARAEKRPGWSLEVSYADRGSQYSDMVSVGVRIPLPLFAAHRQDPVIASKRAGIDRVAAEREDARRAHVAELRGAIALWETAQNRVTRYERELVPLAQDRADAAIAAYRGGRGDLFESLVALNDLVEQHLAALDRLAELGEAWASLHYAFVQERR